MLWIYGHEAEDVALIGESRIYRTAAGGLEWHFCPTCGCVAFWRSRHPEADGRLRIAVNVRLAEPETHADQRLAKRLNQRYAELSAIVEAYREWLTLGDDIEAAREALPADVNAPAVSR